MLRPLLDFQRESLVRYAEQHKLQWIEDDSNTNTEFDRNFWRHEILPLIDRRFPGFRESWNKSMRLCGEAEQLLQELAAGDLAALSPTTMRLGFSVLCGLLVCFLSASLLTRLFIGPINHLTSGIEALSRRDNTHRIPMTREDEFGRIIQAFNDLFEGMKQVAETGKGPAEQIPSMGCSIKWIN